MKTPSAGSDFCTLMHVIALHARALTQSERSAVLLETPDGSEELVTLGAADGLTDLAQECWRQTRARAQAFEILSQRDLHDNPALAALREQHPTLTSAMVVTIRVQGHFAGVLCVGSKRGSAEFTASNQRQCRMLAARLAVALSLHAQPAAPATSHGSSGWLQQLMDQWPEGFIVVDRGGNVVLQNVAMRTFDSTGLVVAGAPSSVRRLCFRSGSPLRAGESPIERALKNDETLVDLECLVAAASGERIAVLESATPIAHRGLVVGAVSILQELGAPEERLCDERATLLGHDLRQPLNVITMAIGMAQRNGTELPTEQRRAFDRIASAAARLDGMIDRLVYR